MAKIGKEDENMVEQKDVMILAIESSCDETAASVVKNGREVLSNVISSQIELHKLYGGVVPEIASRKHIEKINQVIEEALSEAKVTLDDIDAIGVTYGPGLVGALLVGVAEAKAIAYAKNLPLVGVHHIEGHIKLSKEGNPDAIVFPKAHINDAPYDFSFSGVKSAVLNYINGCKMKGEDYNRADIAASFQKAVTDVLVENAMRAVKEYGTSKFAIAGGVASNSTLRAAMKKACEERNVEFYYPSPIFCTDNAAMIGVAAYYEYLNGTRHGWDLNAVPNLKLGER